MSKSDLVRLKYNDNGFGGGLANFNYENGRWNITFGGAANYFHGKHYGQVAWVRNYVGPINPLQEYYHNTGKKFDSNVYARANYDISREFSAFADLQYRHIHYTIDGGSDNYDWNTGGPMALDIDRRWDFFNPKVGINYRQGSHRAFASWSVAHKEPVRDNFTDGDPSHRPEAERLFDYELGYVFDSRLVSVGANLYFMDYKDQLVVTGPAIRHRQSAQRQHPRLIPHGHRAAGVAATLQVVRLGHQRHTVAQPHKKLHRVYLRRRMDQPHSHRLRRHSHRLLARLCSQQLV